MFAPPKWLFGLGVAVFGGIVVLAAQAIYEGQYVNKAGLRLGGGGAHFVGWLLGLLGACIVLGGLAVFVLGILGLITQRSRR